MRIELLKDGLVVNTVIVGSLQAAIDLFGPDCRVAEYQEEPATVVAPRHATKRAFQNRFPKGPNGVSTKWDVMCLFLADDGYAAQLGVTGAALYELRLLITTGVQRLNASPFVDMGPDGEAAGMTELLVNPAIPEAFRLTAAERTAMMETPLTDAEIYKG